MSGAAEAVSGGELGRWLTYDVPVALLANRALPPRRPLPRHGLIGRLRGSGAVADILRSEGSSGTLSGWTKNRASIVARCA